MGEHQSQGSLAHSAHVLPADPGARNGSPDSLDGGKLLFEVAQFCFSTSESRWRGRELVEAAGARSSRCPLHQPAKSVAANVANLSGVVKSGTRGCLQFLFKTAIVPS
jgi:hypothetical protein